jgi:hypothetical protein
MVRDRTLPDVLCYVILTILVWGVSAFRRGLWQDDVQALGLAFGRSHHPWHAMLLPDASPLRRLTVLPSALANASAYPVEVLQILSASAWLGIALLIGWIVGLLLPGRRLTCFVVVCLTLTATSDYQTASMVPLAYNVAAASFLASAGCALLWLDRGTPAALVGSVLLLAGSLLNMDVAWPAIPFAALLFVWVVGWRPARKLTALLVAWAVVLVPLSIVEWSFLHDPSGYAVRATVPMSVRALAHRTISLWIENFAPWRWAFARPEWFSRPPAAISAAWMVIGSLVAAAVFLIRLRQEKDAAGSGRQTGLTLLFAAMALAANAAYAGVQFSEIHYRTHILSRVWASAAIGIFIGWAIERRPRVRFVGWAIATAFIFLGTWGGMERQDFYLATWRHHQRELASILDAAPSIRPGTEVILRSRDTHGRYLATQADYLTKFWLHMLYGQPELRSLRVALDRETGCKATASGLACWREGEADCVANGRCPPFRFRYEDIVVMDYDYGSGTYQLVRSLQGDSFAEGYGAEAARYRPENHIIQQPWTLRQRRLLLLD